ncbi:MAG TPA: hypothetical protein VLZ89_07465 [Anaerolineales bacterium]|nr:hypothetical protein [Anaerolineales bacterium]
MHWFHIPKKIHNENAIREYEREESRKLGRWIKWLVLPVLLILLAIWLLWR